MTYRYWGEPGSASILVGGQFGSEGKGLIAAWLGENIPRNQDKVLATTNAGAQAGHTTKYRNGREFVCFHLPTIGVVNPDASVYINAGSIIDIDVLEMELAKVLQRPHRVTIHPAAAVITNEARAAEKAVDSSTTKVASTQKGVGATIANKVMRRGQVAGMTTPLIPFVGTYDLNSMMHISNHTVTIEVPQGTGLSINQSGMYPYTTSRDCWVASGLNDAGVHPRFLSSVCMVVRTFPIRVGAIYNELGEKLGDSGPFYPDSVELDWAKDFPGIEPERTTVTKRVRRIASWSRQQYRMALSLNRPDVVALTFCNYLEDAEDFLRHVELMEMDEMRIIGRRTRKLFSCTPYTEDVTDDTNKLIVQMADVNEKWSR